MPGIGWTLANICWINIWKCKSDYRLPLLIDCFTRAGVWLCSTVGAQVLLTGPNQCWYSGKCWLNEYMSEGQVCARCGATINKTQCVPRSTSLSRTGQAGGLGKPLFVGEGSSSWFMSTQGSFISPSQGMRKLAAFWGLEKWSVLKAQASQNCRIMMGERPVELHGQGSQDKTGIMTHEMF